VQITLSTTIGTGTLGISALDDPLALYSEGGQGYLYYGSATSSGMMGLSLGAVPAPGSGYLTTQDLAGSDPSAVDPGPGLTLQLAGTTTRMFSYGGSTEALMVQTIGANGMPGTAVAATSDTGALVGVSAFDIIGGPTGTQAALAFWNMAGLGFYSLGQNGMLTHETFYFDTAKTYLGNVTDTLTLSVGGADYLVTLSSLEGGVTSFAVDGAGHASLIDSLGTIDGLPLSGAATMQAVTVAGVSYLVIAATNSSALSVVRVNDMGCLFTTDTVFDDATTRFAHPQVLDSFTWEGRSFLVTAGTDAGISVFEMRPDGKLTPFATSVFETGAGLAAVTSLQVAVSGSTADVYVIDANAQKIMDFSMDLSALGGTIIATGGTTNGTSLGDLVWGGSGAQSLNGGGGDDWIFDGSGADTLTGGAGADVFLLAKDGSAERITDFDLHSDRIDLSDWGRIYSASALSIMATANGATISYGSESVTLVSADGKGLSAASFSDSDFIFI
jgi:Ca2+-binding RTX toxin-like protein